MIEQLPERFRSKISVAPSGCWDWKACKLRNGYGRFKHGGETHYAHRFAFELLVGVISDGLQIDHKCRNRACVNPEHLEPVTPRENTMRGETPAAANASKTHCPRGHALEAGNLDKHELGRGSRVCRTCRNERKHVQ